MNIEAPRNEAVTQAVWPATLFVYRDDADILHWKAAAKGARWHNSKSDSLGAVCRQADEVMPDRYEIDHAYPVNAHKR